MSSKEPGIAYAVAQDDDLHPRPIDPSWIIEGSPQARGRSLSLGPDGTISAELWECTAGRFEWRYGVDEIVHILEGEAELTSSSGSVTVMRSGDVVHFASGSVVRWHIPRYIKKVALYSVQVSPLRRLAKRIPFARRVVLTLRAYRARAFAVLAATLSLLPDQASLF